jgi:serine/threonine-protein kinase
VTSTPNPLWDRWSEIDPVLEAALDRPPAERQAFVEAECGADPELCNLVLDLLRSEPDSQRRFAAPGVAASRALIEDLAGRGAVPARIGRYSVIREIARGGMGTVYLAEHEGEGFRQQVAVKVLRRGIDTDDVMRRFVTERRILASLSHPGIARLYDGGTTDDGRPYLVMEYVDGEPITTYCDRMQLALRRRLELVADVCDAVRAAHANLVVHRDLKPSNILVTADGHVKLLDFGIAKLLDPDVDAGHTQTGLYLLTPDYASPEQLQGDPVTTATDVFQLGMLLFRLLAGRTPVRERAAGSARDVPAHPDARRPSMLVGTDEEQEAVARARATTPKQLRRVLAGDLDTIVGKAVRADPSRRYASAEELARDIRRFLAGRTISARPDTPAYRVRMFARRHPWVAPVAAVLILFSGLYLLTQIRHARQLEAETARALEVQQFLVDLFTSADPYTPADPELGRRITVVDALDVGTEKLRNSLTDRPAVRAAILSSISQVYQSLGMFDRALPLREEAMALQESEHGPSSREVRDSMGELAIIRGQLGLDAQLELRERRLELALAADPIDPDEIAHAQIGLARHLMGLNRIERAEDHLLAALERAERGGVALTNVAEATRSLAEVQRVAERLEESEQTARRAITLADEAFGTDSVSAAFARGTLAQTLHAQGRMEEADDAFREGLGRLEDGLGSDHAHVISTKNNQALLWMNAGRLHEAEALLRDLVATLERRHGPGHPSTGLQRQNLGVVLMRQGRTDDARAVFEHLAGVYRQTLGQDSYLRALPLLSLADIHLTARRYRDAEAAVREALETLEIALPEGHAITAVAECRMGRALVGLGRRRDAGPFFDRATPPLFDNLSLPDYRRECLTAAADYVETQGNAAEAARIRAALDAPAR